MAHEQEVIEVIEYIDDSDYDGDGSDYEEVVEIVEEVVPAPRKNFSAVAAYEVGIGSAPPPFLTPKEKAKLAQKETTTPSKPRSQVASQTNNNRRSSRNGGSPQDKPRRVSAKKGPSERRKTELINAALGETIYCLKRLPLLLRVVLSSHVISYTFNSVVSAFSDSIRRGE